MRFPLTRNAPRGRRRAASTGSILALIFSCTLSPGCRRSDPGRDLRYHDETDGYSIAVPAGWNVNTDVLGARGVMIHGDKAGFDDPVVENVTLVAEAVHAEVDVEKYREFTFRVFRNRVPDHEITGQGDDRIAGEKAVWFSYTHEADGVPLLSKAYLVVKNGKGYALTWTCSPGEVSEYEPVFERIVKSFRFR